MKIFRFLGFVGLLIAAGLFVVCCAEKGAMQKIAQEHTLESDSKIKIIPVIQKDPVRKEDNMPGENGNGISSRPNIPLDTEEKLLQVINANLDLDKNDEQILVLRKKGDAEAPLQALIFDSVYNSYRGIVAYFRIKKGSIEKGDFVKERFHSLCIQKCSRKMSNML